MRRANVKLKLIALWLFCVIVVSGCSEESPYEPQDSKPSVPPGSMTALQFPTADGCSWIYVSPDTGHSYTAKVAGTRNVGGFAARILESDSEIPVDQRASIYGVPVRYSFFTKDLNSYTEHAYELWLAFLDDTYFQRDLPKRVLWSFPLYAGKEWVVSKTYVPPEVVYTRKVISVDGVITVPAGTYAGVYYVEEYAAIANLPDSREIQSKYWLAPYVGVVKYEYLDPIFNNIEVYELGNFKKSK